MKTPLLKGIPALLAGGTLLLLALPLQAQSLLLNFGTQTTTDNSAGMNPAGISLGTWNNIGAVTSATGLSFSTGDSAAGVTVDLGATVNSTTFQLSRTVIAAAGATLASGVFAGTSPARDYDAVSGAGVVANISGLSAGTYNVFVVGELGSSATPAATNIYAGVNPGSTAGLSLDSSTSFTFTSLSMQTASNGGGTAMTGSWANGTNYVEYTFTINAGDDLTILSYNGTSTSALNLIEIVPLAVPEPGAVWLLLGGALALMVIPALRRRLSGVRA